MNEDLLYKLKTIAKRDNQETTFNTKECKEILKELRTGKRYER